MARDFFQTLLLKSGVAVLSVLLFAQSGQGSTVTNPFKMFKRYFGTIEIASTGKGTRGTGQVDTTPGITQGVSLTKCSYPDDIGIGCTIRVPVPAGVELVAAFLYYEVLEKIDTPSSAAVYLQDPDSTLFAPQNPDPHVTQTACQPNAPGTPGCLHYPVQILGKPLGSDHAAPCWSNGGSTGNSNGAPTLRVYRADVLRYLKYDPASLKRVPVITVQLPDTGSNGNTAPITEGASLVVVYRDPLSAFRSVVIFDGGQGGTGAVTLNNDTDRIIQTINGFDQAALPLPGEAPAKIDYIVGDGQSNFPEQLWVGPGTNPNPFTMFLDSPFNGAKGNRWDDLMVALTSTEVPDNASSLTTKITHDRGSFDCLSFAAMYVSTKVKDDDRDGLLNIWETPVNQGGGFRDPATGTVVDLSSMGANPQHKDLFVESDFMLGTDGHSHNLAETLVAVDLVGNAFKNAPIDNPDRVPGISIHFDLGKNVIDQFVIDSSKATTEGGDVVKESDFPCKPATTSNCPNPPRDGLIFWPLGLEAIKQAHVDPACKLVPGCRTYFSDY